MQNKQERHLVPSPHVNFVLASLLLTASLYLLIGRLAPFSISLNMLYPSDTYK